MGAQPSPPRDLLVRFLAARRPPLVAEVAALLGWTAEQVRREATERGALLSGGVVDWHEAASWVLDSWPLATLSGTLGRNARLLPAGLRLRPLVLQQPVYLITALRAQWQIEPMPHRVARPSTFDGYLTDLLDRTIDPATVAALRQDREFVTAYTFPHHEEDL